MVEPKEGEGLQTKKGLRCPVRGLDFNGQLMEGFMQGKDLARDPSEDPSGFSRAWGAKGAPGGLWWGHCEAAVVTSQKGFVVPRAMVAWGCPFQPRSPS